MTVNSYEFQQSSENGRERMVRIPWARLKDVTPTKGEPAAVTGLIAGSELCGWVYNPGTAGVDTYAILNVADGSVHKADVRNVLTRGGAEAEATWGPINIGDPVFYDADADTALGVKLSTCPVNNAGVRNPRFGIIVMEQDELAADFAKGNAQAGSTHVCAVLLRAFDTT